MSEKIGAGGFGTVYRADQTESVVRRVAVKVIKLGMDSKKMIARFEAERHALAMVGGPLPPLMGAFYLSPLDRALDDLPGVNFLRFMDDWIILAVSRWRLLRAVRIMNQVLSDLELEQHPNQTIIQAMKAWVKRQENYEENITNPPGIFISNRVPGNGKLIANLAGSGSSR